MARMINKVLYITCTLYMCFVFLTQVCAAPRPAHADLSKLDQHFTRYCCMHGQSLKCKAYIMSWALKLCLSIEPSWVVLEG